MRGSIFGDDENDPEICPWEDVRAAQKNNRRPPSSGDRAIGSRGGDLAAARLDLIGQARACPKCGAEPAALTWVYFSTPQWTWEHLCGRAGYLTICEPCQWQVDFFETLMN